MLSKKYIWGLLGLAVISGCGGSQRKKERAEAERILANCSTLEQCVIGNEVDESIDSYRSQRLSEIVGKMALLNSLETQLDVSVVVQMSNSYFGLRQITETMNENEIYVAQHRCATDRFIEALDAKKHEDATCWLVAMYDAAGLLAQTTKTDSEERP